MYCILSLSLSLSLPLPLSPSPSFLCRQSLPSSILIDSSTPFLSWKESCAIRQPPFETLLCLPLGQRAQISPHLPTYLTYLAYLTCLICPTYLPSCGIQSKACLISRILPLYRITNFLSRPTRASFAHADCPSL